MIYKLYKNTITDEISANILRLDGDVQTYIPNDPDNADWQQYQAWLALGNEPEPAE